MEGNAMWFLIGVILGAVLIAMPKGVVCVKGEEGGVLVVDYNGKAYRLVEIKP